MTNANENMSMNMNQKHQKSFVQKMAATKSKFATAGVVGLALVSFAGQTPTQAATKAPAKTTPKATVKTTVKATTKTTAKPTAKTSKPVATAPPSSFPYTSMAPVYQDGIVVKALVAYAKLAKTPVYSSKTATKPDYFLANSQNLSRRQVFLALARDGARFQVKVAERPNGKTGWINVSDVDIYQTDYFIKVTVHDHQLRVYKAGSLILTETVATGQAKYPTPTGSYFIRELAKTPNPAGAYGPHAFGLSAFSNVLTSFGKGNGQVGIHGTNKPGELGTAASHGCIRVPNATITKLAKMLPQGTPVDIIS